MIAIGVDILTFERLSLSLQDRNFLEKNFTAYEIENSLDENQAVYFSKIFSCKEAVFKALKIEADALKSWHEIEIVLQNGKAPEAKLSSTLLKRLELPAIQIQLSLSYETDLVCAVALAISGGILE